MDKQPERSNEAWNKPTEVNINKTLAKIVEKEYRPDTAPRVEPFKRILKKFVFFFKIYIY